jgi:hypothetical protein
LNKTRFGPDLRIADYSEKDPGDMTEHSRMELIPPFQCSWMFERKSGVQLIMEAHSEKRAGCNPRA